MLEVSQLVAHLRFTTPAKLQYWMGSAFRGAFGRNIRQICCVNLRENCQGCNLQENCLYFHLYEQKEAKKGYAPPPKPIVLVPPFFGKEIFWEQDGFLDLELLLIGDFGKYIPHVILGLNLLGKRGLGSIRYENMNRFVIESIESKGTNATIFDGQSINLLNFKRLNLKELALLEGNEFIVKFRTPFTGPEFPPDPVLFLHLIRNRFIRLVNEYGTQERIPEFVAEGELGSVTSHFHKLPRYSSRSEKTLFKGYTGIVTYKYSFLNATARWLLHVGAIMGCGSDIGFGCGFYDIIPNPDNSKKQ